MIHIGIDFHSRNMTLAAINDNGELLAERKITNSSVLLEQFFADLPRPVQAVVECTSFWFWLADWCSGHDSGGKQRHRSGNKDGNRYLRTAYNQAAVIAFTRYAPVRAFYNKIKRRSGKAVARTVVAKELAKITWHVLSKNEPYKGFKGVMTPIRHQNYWPQSISPRT